jgi:hypothetical protein
LAPRHRDFGAFQALLRVFAHPNYEKLCRQIPERDIVGYLKSLDEGISQRFQDKNYSELLKQAAFEITAQHIGTGPEMATHLAEGYVRVGDSRALEILRALGARSPKSSQKGSSELSSPSSQANSSKVVGLLTALSGLLPRWLRKFLFKALMSSSVGRTKLASWNFNWRDR